ncbi:TetR/AcrR family transcriptional regulator [Mycolicibacterium bacteremicum]|uniref:TetR/AcrR family transcriptional regulator n=1 Tax=Mycolicibacterium bacteremicum TaxID=564198 RepID=UPI0026EB7887|nr:TetR family transcriptional regulator [Mycolicibacterium bacteremicum]
MTGTLPGYKQARRDQIVGAALDLLKSGDYEQIQMRDVAEAAHVALGTLYRYFTSKEHVYAAVLMEWAQPVFDEATADAPPTAAQVREKMRGIIASFERRPAFFKVCMLLQNTSDANARACMDRFAAVAQQTLAADFAALGEQESADTAIMAWGIISTMLSGSILRDLPMADSYRVVDAFVDLIAPRLPTGEGRG